MMLRFATFKLNSYKFQPMRLLLPLLFISAFAHAQLPKKVSDAIDKIEPKCIAWRHQLHQQPELGNREFKTAKLVADHLRQLGLEVKEQVAKTGVVAILKGGKPGPCIALRADMDALPVTERVPLPYASKVKTQYNNEEVGVMHACGHDTHVAMLMSVAEVLTAYRSELKGTVKFIFQPAEEGAPDGEEGGAALMVKEGVMENPRVDAVFGLHIESNIEAGTIEYKPGAFMAAADFFSIKIKGRASHGSQPWKGADPIAAAAQIINGLQYIVSRYSELTKAPVVITVGKIQSGVRNNIIPEECTMLGTIRTLDSAMQLQVHEHFYKTIRLISEAASVQTEAVIDTKTLVTFNDPALVNRTLPSLRAALGADRVKEREWVTGAEDFSYYGTKAPAFFFYLGGMPVGNDPAKAPPHHTPDFFVDDSGMKPGIRAFCQIVIDFLK